MIALDELLEKSEGDVSFRMKRAPSGGWPKNGRLTYFNNGKKIIRFFDTALEAEFYITNHKWS